MKQIVPQMSRACALLIAGVLAAGSAFADKPEWAGGGNKHERKEMRNGRDREDRWERDSDRRGGKSDRRFADHQRSVIHRYYAREFQSGRCPPGLAKKHNGCLPPGQAKKWRVGYALPRDVVYYDLPRTLVVEIGVPPAGYKYVRVAGDILMLAVGTGMVVDAIQDLGRM